MTQQTEIDEPDQLVPNFEELDNRTIHDVFIIAARGIEQSLQACGAQPGRDYTLLDLYKLALPFAVERFKEGKDLAFFG